MKDIVQVSWYIFFNFYCHLKSTISQDAFQLLKQNYQHKMSFTSPKVLTVFVIYWNEWWYRSWDCLWWIFCPIQNISITHSVAYGSNNPIIGLLQYLKSFYSSFSFYETEFHAKIPHWSIWVGNDKCIAHMFILAQ